MAEDRDAASSPAIRLVIRAKLVSEEIADPAELKAHWRPVPIAIAAIVLLAIVVASVYFFASDKAPPAVTSSVAAPPVVAEAPPVQPPPPEPETETEAPPPPPEINKVIPAVSPSASATIRGTIRVSVRVIVGEDGNVVAATSEDPGPSRYFERISLDAAKKWTFGPGEKRLMRVKFNYTRTGTTADASLAR